jgi:hypothetical protein
LHFSLKSTNNKKRPLLFKQNDPRSLANLPLKGYYSMHT